MIGLIAKFFPVNKTCIPHLVCKVYLDELSSLFAKHEYVEQCLYSTSCTNNRLTNKLLNSSKEDVLRCLCFCTCNDGFP